MVSINISGIKIVPEDLYCTTGTVKPEIDDCECTNNDRTFPEIDCRPIFY